MIYRDATIDDLGKIVEIYNSIIASRMVTADTETVSVESRIKWFEDHNSSHRPLWVVVNDNKEVVAWVSIQSFYGRPAYDATVEISIYLDQKYRGRGLGKQILQYSIEQVPNLGIKTLLAFIFAHNEPSLSLFRNFGFEDWATLPRIASLDENECDLKILGKRIV